MNSWLTHILSFIGGIAAKWLQDVLHDRKSEWKGLREQVLRPIREQVHGAIPQLEHDERVTTVDLTQWDRLVASGRSREIPGRLGAALQRLYTTDLPTHDRAWLRANDEVPKVMQLADENFGGTQAGADLPLARWRRFLTGDKPDLEIIGWGSDPVRIWNRQLEPTKLLPLHGLKENLLQWIWNEGEKRPTIVEFRQARLSCLDNAKYSLTLLDTAIDGDWVTRVSKRLARMRIS
jgi:hypothetical protein